MAKCFESGFGERLREERERLGYSQKEFAELAGVKRATQYLYEIEENSPNYRYFKAIAEMGVDIQYLFYKKKQNAEILDLSLDVLEGIFFAVEEYGRDDRDRPLPYEKRLEFFRMLCAAYSGRETFDMDPVVVKKLISK